MARKPADQKACRGQCKRVLAATTDNFTKDGHGKLRHICRTCDSARREVLRTDVKRSGYRVCAVCHLKRHITLFPLYMREGDKQRREACEECLRRAEKMDPVEEAEVDFADGLNKGQRWAIALAIVLGRRGLTIRTWKALRGVERTKLEERWSALMKEMARDMGEWQDEWDRPNYFPTRVGAQQPRRAAA